MWSRLRGELEHRTNADVEPVGRICCGDGVNHDEGTPKVGDKVSWDSSGGHSTGKVVKKQTSPTQIKGHKVAASKDNPQHIVKNEKSGKIAAHKASELKKG